MYLSSCESDRSSRVGGLGVDMDLDVGRIMDCTS